MGTINVDMCDGIAVLELDNGVTNAVSPGLAADLADRPEGSGSIRQGCCALRQ